MMKIDQLSQEKLDFSEMENIEGGRANGCGLTNGKCKGEDAGCGLCNGKCNVDTEDKNDTDDNECPGE